MSTLRQSGTRSHGQSVPYNIPFDWLYYITKLVFNVGSIFNCPRCVVEEEHFEVSQVWFQKFGCSDLVRLLASGKRGGLRHKNYVDTENSEDKVLVFSGLLTGARGRSIFGLFALRNCGHSLMNFVGLTLFLWCFAGTVVGLYVFSRGAKTFLTCPDWSPNY